MMDEVELSWAEASACPVPCLVEGFHTAVPALGRQALQRAGGDSAQEGKRPREGSYEPFEIFHR